MYGDLALDTDDMFTEESPYRPAHAVQRVEGRRRPRRARLPRDVGPAGHDHELRQQLRAVPVPREGDPVLHDAARSTTGRCRCTPRRENRREWIHALDHCRAIDAVLERGRVGETYHVGTGVEKSIEEIADAVLAELGKPPELKTIVPDRPGHDRRYVLDWSKIRRELGWEPRVAFDAGIAETIDWYAEHRDVVGAAPRARARRRGIRLGGDDDA